MKHKKKHFLSILLIIVLALFTVATSTASRVVNRFPERLNTEIYDEYLYIKIKTINNPNEYTSLYYYVSFYFKGKNEEQRFQNNIRKGRNKIILLDKNMNIIEQISTYGSNFETFVENDLLIIKIKEGLIKYDDYILKVIFYKNWNPPKKDMNNKVNCA